MCNIGLLAIWNELLFKYLEYSVSALKMRVFNFYYKTNKYKNY